MDGDTELSVSLSPSAEEEAGMAASDVESSPPPPSPKRKRGRPRKLQKGVRKPPLRREKEVEVVCFVCLERVGSEDLIACQRRGCLKVYHRECVSRDDALFRSRGRWSCSWHVCSDCGKSAQYMCYTCTYSLCKTCYRRADFFCVRGNKGFCETCYETLMLIESNEYSGCKQAGVDFNDKSSWEYLFKQNWSALRGKLSLTIEELSACKSPWEVSAHKEYSSEEFYNASDDQVATSDGSSGYIDGSKSSRKKARRHVRNAAGYEDSLKQVESVEAKFSVKEADDLGPSMYKDIEWGSNELVDFVAHMKDGDTSWLSQFDVQALLLEYIKQNNLRDPHRKSQIICNSMLKNLFKKERVGHFEMLKLLESHFLIKGASQVTIDDSQGFFVEPDSGQTEEHYDALSKISSNKRHTSYKRAEEREAQSSLADCAAIDSHNINLIYLRRSLMEGLLDSAGKFSEEVVGCFVRIRIPSTVQSQDMYRLVQVVGTSKGTVKYKIGKKTTDTLLQILNLQKTESLTANAISDQEFTKEECQRLRQCIKCGLLNRLTVGGVQEKARALQTLRIDDWMANEKVRLGHLRDRASEKGRRKELRVCVEKLQLLSTREEHRHMLHDVAEIHVDPRMDPSYESSDEEEFDDKDQENYNESRESSCREERVVVPSAKESFGSSKDRTAAWKISNASSEANQSLVAEVAQATPSSNPNDVHTTWDTSTNLIVDDARGKIDSFSTYDIRTDELAQAQETDACHSSCRSPNVQAAIIKGGRKCNNNHPTVIPEKSYGAASFSTLVPPVSDIPVQLWISESDNLWHYQGPYGIVQGPVSMTQLRRWSMTGFFPPEMRIWQTSEQPVDSILLADVLIGKSQKHISQEKSEQHSDPQATQIPTATGNGQKILDCGWEGNSPACAGSMQNTGPTNANFFPRNIELENGGRWMNNPAAWSAPRVEVLPGWGTAANAWVGHPQAHDSLRTALPNSRNNYQLRSSHGRWGQRGRSTGRWNQGHDHGEVWNLNRPKGSEPSGQGYERQLSSWGSSGKSSAEPWKSRASNDSRGRWLNDSFDLSTPTPQPIGSGRANIQGATRSASTHVGSGWDATTGSSNKFAHQFPDGSMEPNKAAVDNNKGCWVSSSLSVMKQTDKTDGWGSCSVDSANRVKHTDGWSMAAPKQNDNAGGWPSEPARIPMLKKTDETNGWGSWSAISAKKVKHTDGWVTPAPKQTDSADGWHPEPAGSQMLKQTDKTDGWGSLSAASANIEQTDKTDGWDSCSVDSANRVKHTDGWSMAAPKQNDNAGGCLSEPAGIPMLKKTDETNGWGSWSAISAKKVKHRDGWVTPAPKQTDSADGWHPEPAGCQMLKQTDKTDGWGSLSAASANIEQTDKTDCWGSCSFDSANRVKHTDGWSMAAPKQNDNAGGCLSEPAGIPMPKKTDETNGWGSWSAISAKKVKHRDGWVTPAPKQTDSADGWHPEPAGSQMLKQTDKTDCWGSLSAASANIVKPADGWRNVAPKQKDNADGWCSEPGTPMLDKVKMVETMDKSLAKDMSKCLHTEDTPQQLEIHSTHCNDRMYLPNNAISFCGSGTNELNGDTNMNQMLQGDCYPTLLSTSQVHLDVQGNEPCPAFTSPAVEDLPNSTTFVSGYGANGLSGAMNKNQVLQGDFPSSTPLSEGQGLLEVHPNEPESAFSSPGAGKTDLDTCLSATTDNDLQSVLNAVAEAGSDKGPTIVSEAKNSWLSRSVMEVKLVCPVVSIVPVTEHARMEASSTQRCENSSEPKLVSESQGRGSTEKHDKKYSTPSSAPLKCWKQNQTLSQSDTDGGEWSLPSPTPSARPSGSGYGIDSPSNKGEQNPWITSEACTHPSSQLISDTIIEPQRHLKEDWVNEAKVAQSTDWDHLMVQKNPNRGTGTVSDLNGSSKTEGGNSAPKSMKGNTGCTASASESVTASTNWASAVPGKGNDKTGWEPALQESVKPNDGWGAAAQGNSPNQVWGAAARGSSNLETGWGNTKQNLNWGAAALQENVRTNGGWGTVNGGNNWVTRQNQDGNMYDKDKYGSWNYRLQPRAGGGASLSFLRGRGEVGVCKFHQSGYCKKGSSCNYLHT